MTGNDSLLKNGTNMALLVMAGGLGKRFWPYSTRSCPKQFLPIADERPMLTMTYERLAPIVPMDHALLFTNKPHTELALSIVADLVKDNVFGEPAVCNTAPPLALGTAIAASRWGADTVMIVSAADHFIRNEDEFRRILACASLAAQEPGLIVTIGIQPDRAYTGYGYLQQGEHLRTIDEVPVYRLERFIEKPDQPQADKMFSAGGFLWNMGTFVWRCDTFLNALQQTMPDLSRRACQWVEQYGTQPDPAGLQEYFGECPEELKTSVDYGVMEQYDQIATIPADVGWDDVGAWPALARLRTKTPQGNVIIGNHVGIDTKDCIIAAGEKDSLVVTIGVENLVVVHHGKMTFVCPPDRIQEIKQALGEVEKLPDGEQWL